jgi:flagellar basal-body rod modification protein FlgD
MSTIQPTTNPATFATNAATATGAASPPAAPQPGGTLDQNAFLKLMMVQMKNQDPLNPSDPTQYLSELAQFTTLEQETNIATSSSTAATAQTSAAALALLGHTVSYTDANGNAVSGAVQKVGFTSTGPTLTVGGITGIDPASVYEVS